MLSKDRGRFNDALIQRFVQIIARNTGLYIREQDRLTLVDKILLRMRILKLSLPETYYHLLDDNPENGNCEWQELATLLTIPESYFFRDLGQFSLLRNRIIPELIERKKTAAYAEGQAKPSLRIWSAGCSTGEEPYSLAILITQLIPDWETNWNIFILGTDINPEVIKKAKRGIYSPWSFRLVDSQIQKRYFNPLKNEWQINQNICDMVTFQTGNLLKDTFPSNTSNIRNMDLILCRNVFVYFEAKAIADVLKKFYNTLKPGGYLLTGHAELQGQDLGSLQTKLFGESVIYQRREDAPEKRSVVNGQEELKVDRLQVAGSTGLQVNRLQVARSTESSNLQPSNLPFGKPFGLQPATPTQPSTPPATTAQPSTNTILSEAETHFQRKEYALAIKKTEQVLELCPRNFGAYYLMGNIYANLGEYKKALHYCKQALAIDSLSAAPYYLLAHIAEEQGDIEGAKNNLKKIIYLAPSSIYAYLELSLIYEIEGNLNRANKMQTVALEMLTKLHPLSIVEPPGKLTAGELMMKVKKSSN